MPTLLTDASSDALGHHINLFKLTHSTNREREADQTIFHHRRMNKIKRRRKLTRSQTRLLNIVPCKYTYTYFKPIVKTNMNDTFIA